MLRSILGFLPLVLDLAGIFLGLALHCLSLALSLLAQTHDRSPFVSCGTSAATCGPRSRLSCRRRGAPMAPRSTPGEAQTFQISRRELFSHLRRRAARMRREVLRMDLGQPDGVNVAKELARDRADER